MAPQITVMAGELGDIFWDLPSWITYSPGYDIGCTVYVANPTEEEKEYALMARLFSDTTVISEESIPVFGYAWFEVDPGDFIRLRGALRFDETNAGLALLLYERETGEVADSVTTLLVSPAATGEWPWPGAPGAPGYDWSSLLMMILPLMLLAVMLPMVATRKKKKEIPQRSAG